MEEDREIDGPLTETDREDDAGGRVSMTSRSLLCALWGIFFLFIALNPLGMFLMLYVLIVPAWVIGCAGLYCGIWSLAKRQGGRAAAATGIVLNALVVLSPLYPFVAG